MRTSSYSGKVRRQGLVRTAAVLPALSRKSLVLNQLDHRPTAGIFAKVRRTTPTCFVLTTQTYLHKPSRQAEEMRREGRQHGLVRTHSLLQSSHRPRALHQLHAPPTAGVFSKVPSKPTNHSKFIGRCGGGKPMCKACHAKPASKSRGKAKGSSKLRDGLAIRRGASATEAVGILMDRIVEDQWFGEDDGMKHEALAREETSLNQTDYATGDGDWFLVGEEH
ncbi:hypothetical protein BHM03_00034671 [Ensete ventricosum]|nr:hypothetical protein BHM03_00034671 [Ensete ventricosum]